MANMEGASQGSLVRRRRRGVRRVKRGGSRSPGEEVEQDMMMVRSRDRAERNRVFEGGKGRER